MIAIKAKGIDFYYNSTQVIHNLSMLLRQGEFLGIIGPNGAGKSTLLRLLCGILRPKEGEIELFGTAMSAQSHKTIARQIAFVPQETHFTLNFTVEDIVRMGRYPYKRPFEREDQQDRTAIEDALEAADVAGLRARTINSLSSGERQLVVVARALAQSPKVMLLDEPTSHLDLHHQCTIMALLEKFNNKGISIAIVHHDLNLASLYCKNLILMRGGRVYAEGAPADLINKKILKEIYGTDVTIVTHPEKAVPQIFMQTKVQHEDNNKSD
jgi:iron complex transport system ATP-binding protein